MKFEAEATTLSEAMRLTMAIRDKTFRDIASELGMTVSTVWRAVRRPGSSQARHLMRVVKWMDIDWNEFAELWDNEC